MSDAWCVDFSGGVAGGCGCFDSMQSLFLRPSTAWDRLHCNFPRKLLCLQQTRLKGVSRTMRETSTTRLRSCSNWRSRKARQALVAVSRLVDLRLEERSHEIERDQERQGEIGRGT